MTQHIHHDLIVQWAKDTTQVVEYFVDGGFKWIKDTAPIWCPNVKYRIRHKHQDLIDRKAARPELIKEWVDDNGKWHVANDMWWPDLEYRLVEPAKPKKKMWQWVVEYTGKVTLTSYFYANEKEAMNFCRGCKVIQRADWTEIEVEG